MRARMSTMLVGGLAATCVAGGVAVAALAGGASAEPAPTRPAPAVVADQASSATSAKGAKSAKLVRADRSAARSEGVASMSSPYLPGVPHVPSDVLLVLGPDGSAAGARYVGPEGSLFNGSVRQVDQRVDAWWAEQMAAGVTPEEADRKLAHPRG